MLRHSDAGKGDSPRPVDKAKYDSNYDEIDWGCEVCGKAEGHKPDCPNLGRDVIDKDFYKRKGLNLEVVGVTYAHPGWLDSAETFCTVGPTCARCSSALQFCRRPVGPDAPTDLCLDCFIAGRDTPLPPKPRGHCCECGQELPEDWDD